MHVWSSFLTDVWKSRHCCQQTEFICSQTHRGEESHNKPEGMEWLHVCMLSTELLSGFEPPMLLNVSGEGPRADVFCFISSTKVEAGRKQETSSAHDNPPWTYSCEGRQEVKVLCCGPNANASQNVFRAAAVQLHVCNFRICLSHETFADVPQLLHPQVSAGTA